MLLLLPAGSGRGEKLGTAGDAGGLPAPGGARLVSGSRWYPEPKGGYLGWRSRRGCSGLRRGARCRQAGREGTSAAAPLASPAAFLKFIYFARTVGYLCFTRPGNLPQSVWASQRFAWQGLAPLQAHLGGKLRAILQAPRQRGTFCRDADGKPRGPPWPLGNRAPLGVGDPPRTLLQPPLPPPPKRSAGFLSSSPPLGMWKDPDLSIPSLPDKPLQSKVHSPVLCGEREHTACEGWHSHHLVHLWRAPRGAAVRVKEEPAKCKASRLIC